MTESSFGTLIESTLRVATWNIWWRFGPWEERLPAIVETLRRVDADVVCLQEVWIELDTGRSSAQLIAEALGLEGGVAVANRADLEGVGFANAVLSRWPIVGEATLPLTSPPDLDELRTALRADIEGPRGPFQVVTTHLHWRFDHGHIRQDQVRQICRFIGDAPARSYPAVLCGDLNAEPWSDEVRMLTGRAAVPAPPLVFHDAWDVAGVGPGETWSNDNPYAVRDLEPARRIDYLLAGFPKQGGAGHVVSVERIGLEAIDGVVPSDHDGLVAELRY